MVTHTIAWTSPNYALIYRDRLRREKAIHYKRYDINSWKPTHKAGSEKAEISETDVIPKQK
jgi:hypothetical protein